MSAGLKVKVCTPTPPGNSDRCENKVLPGKAIRKNMKTKGKTLDRHRDTETQSKGKWVTLLGFCMDVKTNGLREKQFVRL